MIKVLFCLNRKEGMTHREFGEYWYHEHADLVTEMPNLQRYNLGFPDNPEAFPYDGMAELYFEDVDALDEAMASEAGERAATDIENFADTDDMFQLVVEERTIFDDQ
jgi:uncharacterized protein (TIGR02118 family)